MGVLAEARIFSAARRAASRGIRSSPRGIAGSSDDRFPAWLEVGEVATFTLEELASAVLTMGAVFDLSASFIGGVDCRARLGVSWRATDVLGFITGVAIRGWLVGCCLSPPCSVVPCRGGIAASDGSRAIAASNIGLLRPPANLLTAAIASSVPDVALEPDPMLSDC